MEQWNGGAMDGFYTPPGDRRRQRRDRLLHGHGAAVLLQPLPKLRAVRELLLLAARADVAEPLLLHGRHVGRNHHERHLGIRHLRLLPIILDLLDAAGVTWKIYNLGIGQRPVSATPTTSPSSGALGPRPAHDARRKDDFLTTARRDAAAGLVADPELREGLGRAPAGRRLVGMDFQEEMITALRESPHWESSAFMLTYDEHGGFFDHVAAAAARRLRARHPRAAVGHLPVRAAWRDHLAQAGRARLDAEADRAAAGLPTLASRNHHSTPPTPTGGNYEANGAPAPPRDGYDGLSDLTDLFKFDD